MIPISEAIRIILEQAKPLPTERINLSEALGRVLAEEIIADSDLPPFDRAQMDGYAVRSSDLLTVPARLRVVGESAAGRGWHSTVNEGEAVRIMTGAPVPAGSDSVQKVEVTSEADEVVLINEATRPGQFIVPRASEIRKGEKVLFAGEEINAAMMAMLASFGYAEVLVSCRPRVAVLATGTELVKVNEKPSADQIRDSNTYSLSAYAQLTGATVERLPLAGDDPEVLKREIADAVRRFDVLVLSGGVSMGVYD
ncbi:MAG TPA: molybdopterin molybdotransferase MoeA, partial [Pyrinomonadaceae bacterium]